MSRQTHPAEQRLLDALFGEKKPVRDECALAQAEAELSAMKKASDAAGVRAILPKINALRRGER